LNFYRIVIHLTKLYGRLLVRPERQTIAYKGSQIVESAPSVTRHQKRMEIQEWNGCLKWFPVVLVSV